MRILTCCPYSCCLLAGPEEFSESDNDKLPVDLQYLGDDKERETDSEIRLMLVECLMMVRPEKNGRKKCRSCTSNKFSVTINTSRFK